MIGATVTTRITRPAGVSSSHGAGDLLRIEFGSCGADSCSSATRTFGSGPNPSGSDDDVIQWSPGYVGVWAGVGPGCPVTRQGHPGLPRSAGGVENLVGGRVVFGRRLFGRLGARGDIGEQVVDELAALDLGPVGAGRRGLGVQRGVEEALLNRGDGLGGGLGGLDAVRDPVVVAEHPGL